MGQLLGIARISRSQEEYERHFTHYSVNNWRCSKCETKPLLELVAGSVVRLKVSRKVKPETRIAPATSPIRNPSSSSSSSDVSRLRGTPPRPDSHSQKGLCRQPTPRGERQPNYLTRCTKRFPNHVSSRGLAVGGYLKSGIQAPPSGFGKLARGNTQARWGLITPINSIAGCCSKNCWRGLSLSAASRMLRNSSTRGAVHSMCSTGDKPRIFSGGWPLSMDKSYALEGL